MGLHYLNGEIVDDANPLAVAIVGITGTVEVDEVDGTPSVQAGHLTFPNGSVTDNGSGHVTVAFPVTVPQSAVADVAGTTPAGGTGATAGAYDTSAHRDALIATVAEIKAQLNSLLAELRTAGILTP